MNFFRNLPDIRSLWFNDTHKFDFVLTQQMKVKDRQHETKLELGGFTFVLFSFKVVTTPRQKLSLFSHFAYFFMVYAM